MGCVLDRIVVIGGGGHAKVLISVLKKTPNRSPGIQTLGTGAPSLGGRTSGTTISFPSSSVRTEAARPPSDWARPTCPLRGCDFGEQIEALGFDFPVIVSPQAVVNEDVELDPGRSCSTAWWSTAER